MDFNFEELAENTSPEFVAHIKSEMMGDKYQSKILKYEVERDDERSFQIMVLEAWLADPDRPQNIARTVLTFTFFRKHKSFETRFSQTIGMMEHYIKWANEEVRDNA
ncbi:hypothetical protein AB4114_10915 [Paenibacillus sp. 2RAB27]|uniref:hypothetical protein n=1 Tax=Paenibacillus sp. 2RAB27 TaxID=3232991 RepID=UPI003F977002